METVRGSEKKGTGMMSAVKPMRLSFRHILDDNMTSAGSPFKKRLNDIFSTGAAANKCFAFEDIILNTSPERMEGLRRTPFTQ